VDSYGSSYPTNCDFISGTLRAAGCPHREGANHHKASKTSSMSATICSSTFVIGRSDF